MAEEGNESGSAGSMLLIIFLSVQNECKIAILILYFIFHCTRSSELPPITNSQCYDHIMPWSHVN